MIFRGLDLSNPINRIKTGFSWLAVNVRTYLKSTVMLRTVVSNAIVTLSGTIQAIQRMNDTTPQGPVGGYALIISQGTNLYIGSTQVASGLSGKIPSLIPFRPNASVRPWMYVGDSSQNVTLTGSGFHTNGMFKVQSDGTTHKTGIKEPQVAPIVGIQTTSETLWITLPANTPPWTNIGGANPSYNYSGTDTQPPYPAIISTPVPGATVTLTVTGTATVNGASHAPGDNAPSGANYPGHFITGTAKTVIYAFTDSLGNIIATTSGGSGSPVVGNVGASAVLTVPLGAKQLQIGIDSQGGNFAANSGSYLIQAVISTSAVISTTAISGTITAYIWGDSPHSGPVATYIWKSPSDGGTGTARTIDTAAVTTTGGSLILDSTPEDGTVPVTWTVLNSSGSVIGTPPLFSPALEVDGYQDFNCCIVGSLYFPASGTYTVQIQNKDQVLFGMGGGITSPLQPVFGFNGQAVTVANAWPLVFVSTIDGSGGNHTTSFSITVPALGVYPFELDWDYWEHTGRSLIVKVSPTPGAAVAQVNPLPQGVRTSVSYAYKYRASDTGAVSNPSPASALELTPVLANTVTSAWSPDPQVDKVDYYRMDSATGDYIYVATGPNDALGGTINGVVCNTPIVDKLSDADLGNQVMDSDDFEPVPSIDTPKSGKVTVVDGVVTWVSGDQFNTRWLPGTEILIGSPTQQVYTLVSRPTSPTTMVIPDIPDMIGDPAGSGVQYNIAEPILGNQPLQYLFGPTDNINFCFGVGDNYRPGTLYWSKGSNLDSWPDTNQMDVTDPNEALVNGAMSAGLGVLFSIKRAWVILPNFFNAEATATGTSGSPWTLQNTSVNRGLFIARCLAVEGGGRIFFRVGDGIDYSERGSASRSITDDDLYPLFAHEGSTVQPVIRNGVTIIPPDDSKPDNQTFNIHLGYLYYDYIGIDGVFHTLVLDIESLAWIWDDYSVTAYPIGNPSFNTGDQTGWNFEGTQWTLSSGAPFGAGYMAVFTGPGTAAVQNQTHILCAAGEQVFASVMWFGDVIATGNVLLRLFFFDVNNVQLAEADSPVLYTPRGQWSLGQCSGVAPVGSAYAIMDFAIINSNNTGQWKCTQFVAGYGSNPAVVVACHAPNIGMNTQGVLIGCTDGTVRQMVSSPGSTAGTLISPAIGGVGYMHCRDLTFEYKSTAEAILTMIAVDTENNSYASEPVFLPSTNDTITKAKIDVDPNKWKLMQIRLDFFDAKFQVFLDGFVAMCKVWGSTQGYAPVQLFGESGGLGNEP